jgi:hypothetical protein
MSAAVPPNPRPRRTLSNRPTRSASLGFPLRRTTTPIDHIDGLVVDEYDHDPRLHPHHEEHDDSDSSHTVHEEPEEPVERQPTRPVDLEKGRKQSKGVKSEPEDPRTRRWKDDIVTFDSVDDPANPKNWTSKKKLQVLVLYGLSTMCATFASSVFSSASSYYARQYGITTEVAVLGVSLFVLGVS